MTRWWREFWKPALRCARVGHEAAIYHRRGTRRSNAYRYVAEGVTQRRLQCSRCGTPESDWADLPETVRGFTGYSAPEATHDRVMYGGGDWGTAYPAPREAGA